MPLARGEHRYTINAMNDSEKIQGYLARAERHLDRAAAIQAQAARDSVRDHAEFKARLDEMMMAFEKQTMAFQKQTMDLQKQRAELHKDDAEREQKREREWERREQEREQREQKLDQEREKREQEREIERQRLEQEREKREQKLERKREKRERKREIERQKLERKREKREQKREREWEKIEKIVSSVGKIVGGMGETQGRLAEDFFYEALSKTRHIGHLKFPDIRPNVKVDRDDGRAEYDLVMNNGRYVAIVEVKLRLRKTDVEKVNKTLMPNAKRLLPEVRGRILVPVVAGMTADADAVALAHKYGYVVLSPDGQKVRTDMEYLRCIPCGE